MEKTGVCKLLNTEQKGRRERGDGAGKSIGVKGRQIRLQGLLRGCKEKFLAVCGQFKVRMM